MGNYFNFSYHALYKILKGLVKFLKNPQSNLSEMSNSQSIKRKNWSGEEEDDLLKLIEFHYPLQIPKVEIS